MAHLPYFPAIKTYETLSSNDWWMFYPQIEGKTKATNYSIDSLPRKVSMSTMLTFIEENISGVPAALAIQDEGVSLGTNFTAINFIGPLVTAADAGSNVASVTITGTLMSSFTDVSTDFYASTTAWFTNTRTVWDGNEPSEASAGDWLSNWNTATFVMVWNPVNNEWMPIPAFDIVDNLAGASENIYNVSGQLTSSRSVDLNDFSLSFYTVDSYAYDALQVIFNPSVTGSSNYLRINGHRIRPLESGVSDIQLGYFHAAASVASDNSIKWFPLDNTNGGVESARIMRSSGVNGVMQIANDGTGGLLLQAGGLVSVANEIFLDSTGAVRFGEYGSGTFTGTATYNLQVAANGDIIEGAIPAAVTDTNFAITNLTATGNRTHDFAQFDLTIDDVNDYTLNAEGEVVISAHDSAQHSIKSITAGTQESWFIRAYDGTDAITVQVIADSVGGASQFEIGTASTGAPILFDTDGYVQVDGQVAQSGEFRIEGLSGAHYMGVKVDSTAGGAATYTLTYPNAIGASNQIFTHDGTGAITLLTEGAHIAVQGTTLAVVPDEEFDLGAFSIGGTAQSATGDGTTTINWGTGNMFNFQFGAFSETFSFTAPTNPGTFILKLVQDGTGSRTATWPGTVKWPEGTAPTLTTTATTGTDIITFYYDGTSYFAVSTLNFS